MALDISIEIVMGAMMADLLPDRPFTMKELAERWQCTERHVRNLALKREIEYFRLGKLYRFPQSAICMTFFPIPGPFNRNAVARRAPLTTTFAV